MKNFMLKHPVVATAMTLSDWYVKEVKTEAPDDAYENGKEVDGYKVWFNKDTAEEFYTWYRKADFDTLFVGI